MSLFIWTRSVLKLKTCSLLPKQCCQVLVVSWNWTTRSWLFCHLTSATDPECSRTTCFQPSEGITYCFTATLSSLASCSYLHQILKQILAKNGPGVTYLKAFSHPLSLILYSTTSQGTRKTCISVLELSWWNKLPMAESLAVSKQQKKHLLLWLRINKWAFIISLLYMYMFLIL